MSSSLNDFIFFTIPTWCSPSKTPVWFVHLPFGTIQGLRLCVCVRAYFFRNECLLFSLLPVQTRHSPLVNINQLTILSPAVMFVNTFYLPIFAFSLLICIHIFCFTVFCLFSMQCLLLAEVLHLASLYTNKQVV